MNMNPHNEAEFDIVSVDIVTPPSSAGYTFNCPVNARIQIIGCSFGYAANANAANRLPTVYAQTPTYPAQGTQAPAFITANQSRIVHFDCSGSPGTDSSAAQRMTCPLADYLYLRPGDSFVIEIRQADAGDTLENITIRYKQWITPTA